MQLTLRLHSTAQRPACAAFLRGTDAGAWLRKLSRWQLPADQLSCYLVPESIRSVRVAGLLVVARAGATLPPDVLEPYGVEAGRLYLPTHAALWPATTPAELQQALLWPRQLWHPAIGLVGFETTDELDLAALLDCPAPQPTDWSRAVPGPAPKAALQRLRVETPSVEQVLQTMRQDVGTTPLTELPRPDKPQASAPRRLLDGLRRGTLRAGLWLVHGLQRWLGRSGRPSRPALDWGWILRTVFFVLLGVLGLAFLIWAAANNRHVPWTTIAGVLAFVLFRMLGAPLNRDATDTAPGYQPVQRPTRPGGPGLLTRLGNRLSGSLNDLEKKRHDEIERLLRLFSDNPAEALKYAIPLGGPYQNRGTAPASDTLGARDTNFNLGGLGGGQHVDSWDVGQYQYHLRRKYEAAAEAEIKAGHYQKAAYIYAHLLSDFAAAARVLEQGGLHREAAALHRDHLHNPAAAAQCLERGGLLLEAATLYAELQRHEQAGDLYQQLEQPQLAARHYERATEQQLSSHDHLDAARLLHDKLHDSARAQEVLLTGWAAPKQSEACLRRYFELAADAPGADLPARVREVYQQHTPTSRRLPLLQVLAQLTTARPTDAALLDTSRELAYEVVGAEAAAGNVAPLSQLRHFLPTDRLLATDVSRFTTGRQSRLTDQLPTSQSPQLDASIEWLHAVTHGPQWVAVGRRDNRLHLARGNWHGNVEYYSWTTTVSDQLLVWLVADEQLSSRILLRSSAGVPLTLEAKHLPRNKYFPASLTVDAPSWLPPYPAQVALLLNDAVAATEFEADELVIKRYQTNGQPLAPLAWRNPGGLEFRDLDPSAELLYHDGRLYSHWGNLLVELPEDDEQRTHPLEIDRPIFHLTRSAYAYWTTLAMSGEEMMIVWQPGRTEPHITWIGGLPVGVGLRFVSGVHVVAASPIEATLYELVDFRPQQVRVVEAEAADAIVAVLPTSQRQQFALLYRSGRVTLHAIPASK